MTRRPPGETTRASRSVPAPCDCERADPVRGGVDAARRVVGGDPVPLPAGRYRVEVQSDPPVTLDPVVIGSGANVALAIGEE